MARSNDIMFTAEYIKNVLYFATVRADKTIKSTPETHYFCIDEELIYENYYSDFGPLNLGCVYRYCQMLNEKLKHHLNKQIIVHYTSTDPKKKANAAFLLGCYGVLYLSLSPKDALKPLTINGATYRAFQDATQGDSCYTIAILDCLKAIKKASDLGFFNFRDFNYEEYERLDKIQGGDLNWIVPNKFLAFIGPVDYSVSLYHPPQMYIDYFLENNVKVVIRLNKRLYDGNVFYNAGIMHYELYFPDGSCPPRHILAKFLQLTENTEGAFAVHCKAGLGRTGSLIGCYLMKHYRMTAHEAIGWMRICRPGSVIGHQQEWLERLEPWLTKQGNIYRKRNFHDTEKFPVHEYGIYSIVERTSKCRPVVISKSPSPPPPMRKPIRPDLSPTPRPQASKVRDAAYKATEKEQARCMRTPSTDNKQKIPRKGDEIERSGRITRRNNAGGEPRPGRPASRTSTKSQASRHSAKSNTRTDCNVNTKNSGGFYSGTPFFTPTGPILKSVHDAKDFLMKSTNYNTKREKQLNSSITVTPHYSFRLPNYERKLPEHAAHHQSPFGTGSHSPMQPQNRRRLGRSPSPPPKRILEQSRATNTPTSIETTLAKEPSKTSLSRLKKMVRDGSIGGASVGAASLGARRDAPAPMRAPSVRSDERPLATQGDMLNSIKFQRRFRDTLNADKLHTNAILHEKSAMLKDKPSIKNANSKTSTGTKSRYSDSLSKEKQNPVRNAFSPTRPSSPIGKRMVQTMFR